MRKPLLVGMCVLMLASAAMAQGKVETKWHCAKPSAEQKLDVGDVAGHGYVIAQGACTATSSDSGFAEKTGAYTEFQEIWKASFTNHGRFNVTMGSGDMVYYTYTGEGPADIKKPASNKWKIVSGTGKDKGIKGSGACTGTRHDDGSSDWVCNGTYATASKP
jgi:hypothetical protein